MKGASGSGVRSVSSFHRSVFPVYVLSFHFHVLRLLRCIQYFQRLFVLDLHIKYLETSSRAQLGLWLARRWKKCVLARATAQSAVDDSGFSVDILRAQWSLQVDVQTAPAPRKFYISTHRRSLIHAHTQVNPKIARLMPSTPSSHSTRVSRPRTQPSEGLWSRLTRRSSTS